MDRLCRHFGECGGCLYQDAPYPEQVAMKSRGLADLFSEFWREPIPVEPSPVVWHYRNKVDLSFARQWYEEPPPKDFERASVLGYKTRGRWYKPLEVEECLIGPEGMPPLLAAAREWMRAQGLDAFDTRTRRGFLKILMVREGKRTGRRMVVLTTADGDFDRASFVRAVLDAYPADAVYRGIYRGFADVAIADEVEVLHGEPAIEERLHVSDGDGLRVLRFSISPFSFFQTNTFATEKLYGFVREIVRAQRPKTLYDLYGGAGGIALACSDLVEKIHSVESVVSATEDGLRNVELNGRNGLHGRDAAMEFVTAKVEDYLKGIGDMDRDATAVVDPPRAGLHPKALTRLAALAPRRIVYVSCNPKILAKELPALSDQYAIREMRGFDLFPHTPHVELVAVLERK